MRRGISLVPVLLLLIGARVEAQIGTPSGESHRVFIAANGGSQAGSRTFGDSRSEPYFGETASWTADYKVANAPSFDVGGGVRVWRALVAGVSVSRFSDTRPASLAGQVPHPFFFDLPRAIAAESRSLAHSETAVHASATWVVPVSERMQVAIGAGPSFFSVSRDMVADISYAESYPFDEATYQDAVVRRVSSNRTGFHAGGDLSWFLTENVGIGAAARFSQARVHLISPADQEPVRMDVGGLQAGLGLRLRFGAR